MIEKILLDILQAVALFFLNPLFLAALLVSVFLGYFRVKRERRSFKIRLQPGLTEFKQLISESWLYGVLLSIIISGVGLVVDLGWLVLFCMVAFISMITFNFKITSPIYFSALAFFILYLIAEYVEEFTYLGWTIESTTLFGDLVVVIPVITGLLLLVEGQLIRRYVARNISPFLKRTKRGLKAAAYKGKRLWLLPVLFLVPVDMVSTDFPNWAQFSIGGTMYSLVPVPLIIGFSQVASSTYPDVLFSKMGRTISLVGIVVVAIGLTALWMPILGWAALVIGVICRMFISIQVSISERLGTFAVSPSPKGVVIAGVLPNSPAEKMGLRPGECIRSVNGRQINNEKELYDAIQINAAHCRLQIIDRAGEVRLMQQVIYRHDHHRLGLLVVQ